MVDTGSRHRWRFVRMGGVDQVVLSTGADVTRIGELDFKLWAALACPVKGLEFDARTLELMDTDHDGRIRAPEVREAAEWAAARLRDPESLVQAAGSLPLAWIDEASADGPRLIGAARRILAGLGKPDSGVVTAADAAEAAVVLAKSPSNGDGVVPPAAFEDEFARDVAKDIVACLGGEDDRSGEKGVSKATVEKFWEELAAYSAWSRRATTDPSLLPLGAATANAAAALDAVRTKVDDWFARCRLAAFDARAAGALNRGEEDWKALAAVDLSAASPEVVAAFPLARVEPGRPLPLDDGLNPAWAAAIAALREKVIEPFLGKGRRTLSEAEWVQLKAKFAPFEAWQAARGGAAVERLGPERVAQILASDVRAELDRRIEADLAVEPEMQAIVDVERLARYCRDLHRLCENFIAFTDFYALRKAVFQAGTLYLDGRACDLCVWVEDPAKHAALAGLAKIYLAYCDCTRPTGEKRAIVAAFTDGDSDNLMVGRNGVFFDRQGRDWDATITRIVENPISLCQAFWSPYKRFIRMVEEMVARRAAAADQAATAKMAGAAQATATAGTAPSPAQPKKIDVGTVAALGVAVGGITAAFGMLLEAFFGLGFWMPLGLLVVVLLISGPSMLIAWLKLRQRNLGPILDASGWAVNGRARISVAFGRALTAVPRLPEGAVRTMNDPYRGKRSRWRRLSWVAFILCAAAIALYLTDVLPGWFGCTRSW